VNGRVGFARAAKLARSSMIVVAGVLALWVVPAVASASPQWNKGGEPITSSQEINWKGTTEIGTTLAGALHVQVKCEDTGSGLAKTAGAGEESKWTFSNCRPEDRGDDYCEREVTMEALKLPWGTQLSTVEGSILDTLVPHGSEFEFHCKVEEATISVRCVPWYGEISATMENRAGGTVLATTKEARLECNDGEGKYIGSQTIALTKGGNLTVK
jgi:hypothetical protein